MTRMIAAVLPLLFAVGQAVAAPPERTSGKMVLDKVADGLRKFRREKEDLKRGDYLIELARTRDYRVAVVLGELQEELYADLKAGRDGTDVGWVAHIMLYTYFTPRELGGVGSQVAFTWWEANKADLRRRAKQLP
jgi:hypothetical protein